MTLHVKSDQLEVNLTFRSALHYTIHVLKANRYELEFYFHKVMHKTQV